MPYFTCDCGHSRYVSPAYLPDVGGSEPIVCENCGKEWEVSMDRSGMQVRAVQQQDETGRRGP